MPVNIRHCPHDCYLWKIKFISIKSWLKLSAHWYGTVPCQIKWYRAFSYYTHQMYTIYFKYFYVGRWSPENVAIKCKEHFGYLSVLFRLWLIHSFTHTLILWVLLFFIFFFIMLKLISGYGLCDKISHRIQECFS